jgi:hypothetical protein
MIKDYYDLQEKENGESGRKSGRFDVDFEYRKGARLDGKLIVVVLSVDVVQRYQLANRIGNDDYDPTRKLYELLGSLGLDDLKPWCRFLPCSHSVLPEAGKKWTATRLHYESCKYELSQGYQLSIQATMMHESSRILEKLVRNN